MIHHYLILATKIIGGIISAYVTIRILLYVIMLISILLNSDNAS